MFRPFHLHRVASLPHCNPGPAHRATAQVRLSYRHRTASCDRATPDRPLLHRLLWRDGRCNSFCANRLPLMAAHKDWSWPYTIAPPTETSTMSRSPAGAGPFLRFHRRRSVPTNPRDAFIALRTPAGRVHGRIVERLLFTSWAHWRPHRRTVAVLYQGCLSLPAGIRKAPNAPRECDRLTICVQLRSAPLSGSGKCLDTAIFTADNASLLMALEVGRESAGGFPGVE
jgi:hypothetical protein